MKNEGDVKKYVKKIISSYDADKVWFFMPPANGYGRSGIPDFLGVINGYPFAIETKFGTNQPTNNQVREIHHLTRAGSKVWIVRNTNCDQWASEFRAWAALCL